MKIHKLKIKNDYAIDVFSGDKPFELRKNDRNFKVGDYVRFVVIDGDWDFKENMKKQLYKITYVLKNVEEYGLDKDYCIFGMRKVIDSYEAAPYVEVKWDNAKYYDSREQEREGDCGC